MILHFPLLVKHLASDKNDYILYYLLLLVFEITLLVCVAMHIKLIVNIKTNYKREKTIARKVVLYYNG
jgi:hypothetical protein